MPERSNGTVSKTVVPLRVPRVRIPVFPHKKASGWRFFLCEEPDSISRGVISNKGPYKSYRIFGTADFFLNLPYNVSIICRSMRNLAKCLLFLLIDLNSVAFSAQAVSSPPANSMDSTAIKAIYDTLQIDSTAQNTCYHSLKIQSDSVQNLKRPYNKNAFKFRYEALKEQLKNPWVADALREILFK